MLKRNGLNIFNVKNNMSIKVAVCQVPDIRENISVSLEWIEMFTKQAEVNNVSLICFPECFLQGYLTDMQVAEKYAIDLSSVSFQKILKQLSEHKPMIIVGLIERENGCLYNTAVVIRHGALIGRYRKTHLLKGEKIFSPGFEYPVFQINDLRFGINICYDTQFAEAAEYISKQSASLLLCPSNNMMKYETAETYKHLHHQMRIQRVLETGLWLLSADVTGESEGRISYGPTSVINPSGQVIKEVPLMETGMIIADV